MQISTESELTKTIKLKIFPSQEQIIPFRELMEQYRQVCNYVSEYIYNHDFELNFYKLNDILYNDIRDRFGLKAQFTESAIKTVIAKYKTVRDQLSTHPFKYKDEKKKWQKIPKDLEWLWKPICFKKPQADFVRNRDYSFVNDGTMLSLNTLDKRVKVAFEQNHFAEYFNGPWKLGTATLVEFRGNWYLHISVTKAIDEFNKEDIKHIVGIDRGLRFVAVSYDEQGKTKFVSGKHIAQKRDKYQKVRQQLQEKGTKSAKRRLKALSGRENRWMTDVNHQISKTLVQEYGENTLFVLEDLTKISTDELNLNKDKKHNRELRSWTFYQLEQFLIYKAHDNKSEIIKVNPKYTSQRCPKCGTICESARDHERHFYSCQCGYKSNDDRIGAMNIRYLGTLWATGTKNPKFTKPRRKNVL